MTKRILTHTRTAQLSAGAHSNLDVLLGQLLSLWNQGLSQRQRAWEDEERSVSYFDQQSQLTALRQSHAHWRRFHLGPQRSILRRLDRAYRRFFKQGGYPRFKGLGRGVRSFELDVPPKVKSTGKRYAVTIKGIGRLKFKHPLPEGVVKMLRVVRTPRRVKLQFVMEHEDSNVVDIRAPVGIDLGVKDRAICSNGYKAPKNVVDRRELKRRQRKVSKARRGSNNRSKKCIALAKQWQKTTEREKGMLHELTSKLVSTISSRFYIEDLKIPNMVKNRRLSRSILEQQWGIFIDMLTYKAERAGGWVRKVPAHNTTQQCSGCGALPRQRLELSDRMYDCYVCGMSMDRDINAAINILQKGQSLYPAGNHAGTLAGENAGV